MARRSLVPEIKPDIWSKVRSAESGPTTRSQEIVVSPRKAISALRRAETAEREGRHSDVIDALDDALRAAPTDDMRRRLLVRRAAAAIGHTIGERTPGMGPETDLNLALKSIEEAFRTPAGADFEDYLVAAAIARLRGKFNDASQALIDAAIFQGQRRLRPAQDYHQRLYDEVRQLLRDWRDLSQTEPLLKAMGDANPEFAEFLDP